MGKPLEMLVCWSVAILAWLCGPAAPAGARDFRAADTQTADYPTVQAVEYMSRIVADRTQGRYRIVVFHSRQLGEETAKASQSAAQSSATTVASSRPRRPGGRPRFSSRTASRSRSSIDPPRRR